MIFPDHALRQVRPMRVPLPSFLQITGGNAANLTIAAATVAALTIALWLAHNESPGGVAGIPIVIPHHSAALLTSEPAHVRDPRVGQIADGIIEAQQREIIAIRQGKP
jgi:hypothetical protein